MPKRTDIKSILIIGAGPIVIAGGKRRLDVVLVAGGDAEADDINQQILAFRANWGRHVLQ